jgi:hypothetical protein
VLHRAGREAEAYAIWESLRKVGAGKDQNATDFNNAIYEADARLRDGEPKRAVALLEPYAANHARFGAQFFPNGVHWATLLAHARFLTGDAAGAEAALARVKDVPQNFTNPAEQMVQYVLDVSAIRLAQGRLDDAWKVLTVEGGKLYDDYGEFSMYYVLQRVRAAEIAPARKDRAAAGRYVAEAKAHLRRDVAPGVMPFLDEAVERAAGRKREIVRWGQVNFRLSPSCPLFLVGSRQAMRYRGRSALREGCALFCRRHPPYPLPAFARIALALFAMAGPASPRPPSAPGPGQEHASGAASGAPVCGRRQHRRLRPTMA